MAFHTDYTRVSMVDFIYYDGNIQLRGSRIKIQNTKDYGLSGKVDYMSNTFIM